MKSAPKLFLVLSLAGFSAACPSNESSNSNQSNQASNSANSNAVNGLKYDVEELELTIKLPFHPQDLIWREDALGKSAGNDRVPGPTDRKLTAVLLFSKEDADKIVAQAQTYRPAQRETVNPEIWFPAELIAQSQTSGDETLKGQSYAANDFYNVPYADGKITRIDGTDYFILELFAK